MTPSRPSTLTVPSLGRSSPVIRRSSVDLPTPLAPTNAARWPSPTRKLTSRSSSSPPGRRQPTWLTWIEPTAATLGSCPAAPERSCFGLAQHVAQRAPEGRSRRSGIVVLGLGPTTGQLDADRVAIDVDGDLGHAVAATARRRSPAGRGCRSPRSAQRPADRGRPGQRARARCAPGGPSSSRSGWPTHRGRRRPRARRSCAPTPRP